MIRDGRLCPRRLRRWVRAPRTRRCVRSCSLPPAPSSSSPVVEREAGKPAPAPAPPFTSRVGRKGRPAPSQFPTRWAVTAGYTMFQVFQTFFRYVASLCFKCFSCFRRMFEVFHLDVAFVAMAIHACFKHMFQMFSDLCCKCFIWMLQK